MKKSTISSNFIVKQFFTFPLLSFILSRKIFFCFFKKENSACSFYNFNWFWNNVSLVIVLCSLDYLVSRILWYSLIWKIGLPRLFTFTKCKFINLHIFDFLKNRLMELNILLKKFFLKKNIRIWLKFRSFIVLRCLSMRINI